MAKHFSTGWNFSSVAAINCFQPNQPDHVIAQNVSSAQAELSVGKWVITYEATAVNVVHEITREWAVSQW